MIFTSSSKSNPRRPAEPRPCLCNIRLKVCNLSGPEVAWIDLDYRGPDFEDITPPGVRAFHEPFFLYAFASPLDLNAHVFEGPFHEVPDTVARACAHDVIVGCLLLEHEPHHLHILRGKAPVSLGIQIAEVEPLLPSGEHARDRPGHLSRNESLTATGRFVVEEDAVAGEETVTFPIVDCHPVGVDLRCGIRAPRVESRFFVLGRRSRSEHLRRGCLVVPGIDPAPPDGLEKASSAETGGVTRVFRHVEAHPYVTLCRKVVDLVGADVEDEVCHLAGIGQVTVVEKKERLGRMRVGIDMVYSPRIESACPPYESVDLVTFRKEEFGKIGPVLACDPRDQRSLVHGFPVFLTWSMKKKPLWMGRLPPMDIPSAITLSCICRFMRARPEAATSHLTKKQGTMQTEIQPFRGPNATPS